MPTYVLVSPPDPLLDRPPIGYANDAFVQLSGYSRVSATTTHLIK
jgi:hypothetical protein